MSISRILKVLGIILSLLALMAYVGYLAVYIVYAIDLFQWPFDYDQGEGFELYDAILFARGDWPYKDSAVYPYYASNYPPLFHLLIIPFLSIFGPRVVAGRVVSFAATLVTSGAIYAIVRRRTGGWFIPLVSGLAYLASPYVYQTGPLCRMHSTMVTFETLAIAFVAEFQHPRHGTRNLILGLLMLLCAGYTKQMAVFTVAAALSYVFLRDVKKAIVSGVALAVVAGTIFWLLNVATDGQWWVNTIQANANEFEYLQTLASARQWFELHTLFILLSVAYLVHELFWARLSAYSLWFFFALGTGALSGKWGAGFNYFTTAIAASCVCSGLALGRLVSSRRLEIGDWRALFAARSPKSAIRNLQSAIRNLRSAVRSFAARRSVSVVRPILTVLVPLLYLWQAPRMLHLPTAGPVFGPVAEALGVGGAVTETHCSVYPYYDKMGYTQLGHLLTEDDYVAGEEILAYARTSDGPVFSEEAMFSLLIGEPVVTNPTQLLNLYNNGLLDTTDMVERVNRQEFGLVIFRARFYPDPVLQAIGQNYTPVERICMNGFNYDILLPRRMLVGAQEQ
jgi:hypothetical protein